MTFCTKHKPRVQTTWEEVVSGNETVDECQCYEIYPKSNYKCEYKRPLVGVAFATVTCGFENGFQRPPPIKGEKKCENEQTPEEPPQQT